MPIHERVTNLGRVKIKVDDAEAFDAHTADIIYSASTGILTVKISTKAPVFDPELERDFEIWSEGYLAQECEGIPAKAQKLGTVRARSFDEACAKLDKATPASRHGSYFTRHSNGVWNHWGCRLYDNEAEARRAYG